MAITWKQIDTDGNGYVDGTEAVTAKAKGVKNVWNNMTKLIIKIIPAGQQNSLI